jgi:hypothetical protein
MTIDLEALKRRLDYLKNPNDGKGYRQIDYREISIEAELLRAFVERNFLIFKDLINSYCELPADSAKDDVHWCISYIQDNEEYRIFWQQAYKIYVLDSSLAVHGKFNEILYGWDLDVDKLFQGLLPEVVAEFLRTKPVLEICDWPTEPTAVHLYLLEVLLQMGCNVNETWSVGCHLDFTPLHCAATRGWSSAIEVLLRYNAEIEALATVVYKDISAEVTPLSLAKMNNHQSAIKVLHIDLLSLLRKACKEGDYRAVIRLLNVGLPTKTCLIDAVDSKSTEIVGLVIGSGADLNYVAPRLYKGINYNVTALWATIFAIVTSPSRRYDLIRIFDYLMHCPGVDIGYKVPGLKGSISAFLGQFDRHFVDGKINYLKLFFARVEEAYLTSTFPSESEYCRLHKKFAAKIVLTGEVCEDLFRMVPDDSKLEFVAQALVRSYDGKQVSLLELLVRYVVDYQDNISGNKLCDTILTLQTHEAIVNPAIVLEAAIANISHETELCESYSRALRQLYVHGRAYLTDTALQTIGKQGLVQVAELFADKLGIAEKSAIIKASQLPCCHASSSKELQRLLGNPPDVINL